MIPAAAFAIRSLNPRELEVIKLVAMDEPNKSIAEKLGLASKTVEHYRASAMQKLGLSSGIRVTHFALHYGLVANIYKE